MYVPAELPSHQSAQLGVVDQPTMLYYNEVYVLLHAGLHSTDYLRWEIIITLWQKHGHADDSDMNCRRFKP